MPDYTYFYVGATVALIAALLGFLALRWRKRIGAPWSSSGRGGVDADLCRKRTRNAAAEFAFAESPTISGDAPAIMTAEFSPSTVTVATCPVDVALKTSPISNWPVVSVDPDSTDIEPLPSLADDRPSSVEPPMTPVEPFCSVQRPVEAGQPEPHLSAEVKGRTVHDGSPHRPLRRFLTLAADGGCVMTSHRVFRMAGGLPFAQSRVLLSRAGFAGVSVMLLHVGTGSVFAVAPSRWRSISTSSTTPN